MAAAVCLVLAGCEDDDGDVSIPDAVAPESADAQGDVGGGDASGNGGGTDDPPSAPTYYLGGANLPWINYGWDLGDHPWGGPPSGFANNRAALAQDFAYLKSKLVQVVRLFLFCDFRTGLEYDGSGNVVGVDPYVYADMWALLDVAQRNGLKLVPVLMDFMLADGVSDEGGTPVGEHPEFVTDPAKRSQLLGNVLQPFLAAFGNHAQIYAWDIMNEPRWAAAVSQAQIRGFVEECADLAKAAAPGKYVTFGNYDKNNLDTYGNTHCNLTQVHHYDYMNSYWTLDTPAAAISAKPVLVGEVQPTSVSQKLDKAVANGYVGLLFWSLNADYSFEAVADEFRAWMGSSGRTD